MRRDRFESWQALLALALMWGTAFLFNGVAVAALDPAAVMAVRIVVAAAALNIVRRAMGLPLPREARAWLRLLPLALTGSVIPFWLIGWGQEQVASGLAGILMAFSPLATVLLAHFAVAGEPLHGRKLAGIALGFFGVVVLLGPDSLVSLGRAEQLTRQLAVLAGAFLYAVNTVLTRRLPPVHPVVFAAGVMLLAAVLAVPLAALSLGETPGAPAAAWLSVAWLGLVPTALATLVHYRLVSSEGAGFASLVSYAIPLVALAVGAFALGEAIAARSLASLGLILGGIAITQAGTRVAAGDALPRHSARTPA